MRPAQVLLAVLVAAAAVGWVVVGQLNLSTRLETFLPEPRGDDEQLMIAQLRAGSSGKLLLIGAQCQQQGCQLPAQAKVLADRIAALPGVVSVNTGNSTRCAAGDVQPQAADAEDACRATEAAVARLFEYRYLLRDFSAEFWQPEGLQPHFQARLADFTSPAGAVAKDVLRADPTLESQRIAQQLAPASRAKQQDGVWVSPNDSAALLVVRTVASGFDAAAQAQLIDAIRAAAPDGLTLTIGGPGAFAATVRDDTRGDALRLSTIGSLLLIGLLLLVYRAPRKVLAGALPLAAALAFGLAVVAGVFGTIHGITLAFGITLLGVALDYPIHLFSRHSPDADLNAAARKIWPALSLGLISTCVAYATLLVAGVDGLRQLGVMTVAGLIMAALVSRLVLPALLRGAPPVAMPLWFVRLASARPSVPVIRQVAAVGLAVAAVSLLASAQQQGRLWQNNVAATSPVPQALLAADAQLREWLGVPDTRYVLAATAPTAEGALRGLESGQRVLDRLQDDARERQAEAAAADAMAEGAEADGSDGTAGTDEAAGRNQAPAPAPLAGYQPLPLPSVAAQRARQTRLPERAPLETAVVDAVSNLPFRAETFAPFVDVVEQSRTLEPLKPSALGALAERYLLQHTEAGQARTTAIVPLQSVGAPAVIRAALIADARERNAAQTARLVDIKGTSEQLIARYRGRLLACLLAASLLILTGLVLTQGEGFAARVVVPTATSVLVTAAVLAELGVALGLFHLIALILVAGLGLDYAIFFAKSGAARARTLHAVLVCAASTLLVFGLLGLAASPVLQAIGRTVALGVLLNVLLAWWLRAPLQEDVSAEASA